MESALAAAGIALAGVALGALIDYLRDLRHRRWAREDRRRELQRERIEELIAEVDRVKANVVALGIEMLSYAQGEAPFLHQPEKERFQAAKVGVIVAVYAPTISPAFADYRLIRFQAACDALIDAAVSAASEIV